MDDLQWLGLEWDGMPIYQSNRSDIYSAYLERLRQQGVVYECHRTRADLLSTMAPHESDGRVVVHREPLPTLPKREGDPEFPEKPVSPEQPDLPELPPPPPEPPGLPLCAWRCHTGG